MAKIGKNGEGMTKNRLKIFKNGQKIEKKTEEKISESSM